MATLNFPDAPDTGDIYFDSNSGFTYEWNGEVWISRGPSTIPNIKELDNISGSFNGSTTTFNLTASSVAVSPATPQQLVINIGNVLQNPGDDYTVSGSTITFTTAPPAGYVFQGTVLGNAFSLGTVDDGTVSPSSFDTSDSYNIGGITVTGITTVNDFTISGIATVANLEPADVKVTGIGTVSNIIMTKDSAGLGATMGAAVGVVTYYGDGSNLTGLGLTFFPISYDPGISSTNIPVTSNLTLDWNHPIKAGSGTITIRSGSASGTVVDQFVVGTSSSITFANNQLTLNPAAGLSTGTQYFVTYPAGSVKSYGDKYQNDQLIYSFTTKPILRTLWLWGDNNFGSLGQNQAWAQINKVSSPTQVPGTTWSANMISTIGTTMAVKTDGTLWSWGYGWGGMLGLNSPTSLSSPTQVGTDTTWNKTRRTLASDTGYGLHAIKTDGTLWAWGTNERGQLGLNAPSNERKSSPTQLPGTTWSKVSMGAWWGHAIKTDGTLWAWGRNWNGALGLTTGGHGSEASSISSPTQVGTDTDWSDVVSKDPNGYFLKTNGTLWVTGYNNAGSLGLNQAHGARLSSPTQIPGTDWSTLVTNGSQSGTHIAVLKSNGTLWTWGENYNGGLGLNTNAVSVSSPTQIGTDTTWSLAVSAYHESGAIKTDGTLWTWGWNNSGELGQNNYDKYSSPTQVGSGTKWDYLTAGGDSFGGLQLVE